MIETPKKWSILIVNYFSSVYIKWQLKILYEFNNVDNFELVIVDNSVDESEKKFLQNLTENYQKEYKNIKLFFYQPHNKTASGQHGEAIEFAKQYIQGQYLLIHDPDFFWLKKNYLKTLENLLENHVAVGAPYRQNVAYGNPKFPSAFGCAYRFADVKNISFKAYLNEDYENSWKEFYESKYYKEGYDFYFDVGWQVRKMLSTENSDNFISFDQLNINNKILNFLKLSESHSFETNTCIYFYNNLAIASHLFRGTFTGEVKDNKDPKVIIKEKTLLVRDKIGEFMYNEIIKSNKNLEIIAKKIKKKKEHKVKLKNFINKLKNILKK